MPAKIKIRSTVGSRRITRDTADSIAAVTRMTRMQMKEVEENLNRVVEGLRKATPEAIEYGLRPIFELSQKYVPVKTGKLKASGYLEVQKVGRNNFKVELGYARGGHPNYAVLVHEDLSMPHKDPTSAKFLERAIDEKLHLVRPRILRYLREVLDA